MPKPAVDHRKPCTLCDSPRDVLVRCQIDSTETWHFVCPGSCWKRVSGGKIDGDGALDHQWYRYGGMWKNKHEAVSAKKPKRKKTKEADDASGPAIGSGAHDMVEEWQAEDARYTKNDKVRFEGKEWRCRKSHVSKEGKGQTPDLAFGKWKEVDGADNSQDSDAA